MTRELSIAYGSTTVGGSSSPGNTREITDFIINTKRFEEFSIEFEFFISATTEALFATEVDTIEDAFATPFQTLTVTQGSATLYSFSQSGNTGLDARPEITKREDVGSGRHRKYRVRIAVGLPANTTAELVTGLREHSVEVSYDPARIRTITISGMFTAVTTLNARQQYEAQIGTLESSVFTALNILVGNRELVEEPSADHTYNTKTMTFRRVWKELIFSQGGSSLNDSNLVRQQLRIERKRVSPGDTNISARRLIELGVTYFAFVDSSNTDLRSKYTSIRSWIITQVSNTLQSGPIALIDESPVFNYDENSISVTMTVMGNGGSSLIEDEVTTEDRVEEGDVLVPAWTGNPMSKFRYAGPARQLRTITHRWKTLGSGGGSGVQQTGIGIIPGGGNFNVAPGGGIQFQMPGGGVIAAFGGPVTGAQQSAIFPALLSDGGAAGGGAAQPQETMIHVSNTKRSTPKRMGINAWILDITENEEIDVYEFYTPIQSSGAPPVATQSRR